MLLPNLSAVIPASDSTMLLNCLRVWCTKR